MMTQLQAGVNDPDFRIFGLPYFWVRRFRFTCQPAFDLAEPVE